MNWGSMFGLDAGTAGMIKQCFNLVIRAVTVALTWSILLGIGLALNWFINIALSSLGASEATKLVLSQIVLAYVTVLGIVATITGLIDAISLMVASVRAATGASPNAKPRGCSDAEQKSPPD